MSYLQLENLHRQFGSFQALKGINISLGEGEFLSLLGPSGCGKTTALRMIAGLEEVTEGEIRIGDQIVNNLPAKKRDIAMVFQNYALYPHMSVYDNMAFGLKMRRLPKTEIRRRVTDAAKVLGLAGELKKKPGALSGGQRQRVAMGRAIVREPRVFLMDEPLSNLDAKLRIQMRAEIARIQRDLAVTTVYVTHDQSEAMTLGDRVSVMQGGRLQQSGIPQQVYDRPANLFVAGFIGAPPMNLLHARLERGNGGLAVRMGEATIELRPETVSERPALEGYVDRRLAFGIRPEDLEDAALVPDASRHARLSSQVDIREDMGAEVYLHLPLPAEPVMSEPVAEGHDGADERPPAFVARVNRDTRAREGEPIELVVDTTRLHFFDLETGVAV
jgi:multiple sugar transport system ATP-binding protein